MGQKIAVTHFFQNTYVSCPAQHEIITETNYFFLFLPQLSFSLLFFRFLYFFISFFLFGRVCVVVFRFSVFFRSDSFLLFFSTGRMCNACFGEVVPNALISFSLLGEEACFVFPVSSEIRRCEEKPLEEVLHPTVQKRMYGYDTH